MSNSMRVFLGFLGGVVFTVFWGFVIIFFLGARKRAEVAVETTQSLVSSIMEAVDDNPAKNVVWFELTPAKKKTVRLHTDMPKDSVRMLLGKPAKTSVDNMFGNVHEDWTYNKRTDYGSETWDFKVSFVNDRLESVYQY